MLGGNRGVSSQSLRFSPLSMYRFTTILPSFPSLPRNTFERKSIGLTSLRVIRLSWVYRVSPDVVQQTACTQRPGQPACQTCSKLQPFQPMLYRSKQVFFDFWSWLANEAVILGLRWQLDDTVALLDLTRDLRPNSASHTVLGWCSGLGFHAHSIE